MSVELDEQCARPMGWIRSGTPEFRDGKWITHEGWRDSNYSYINELPAYSTDPAAARLLEDEIEERGKINAYMTHLCRECGIRTFDRMDVADAYALIRATPEQRAQAFLKAIA
jgi:hypothetical protein